MYMYIRVYTCAYAMYIRVYTCIYTDIGVYIHVYTCIYVDIRVYKCVYAYMCVYIFVYACIDAHIHRYEIYVYLQTKSGACHPSPQRPKKQKRTTSTRDLSPLHGQPLELEKISKAVRGGAGAPPSPCVPFVRGFPVRLRRTARSAMWRVTGSVDAKTNRSAILFGAV